ncbi:MAG: hypothetical protein IJ789_08205 [Bacteroidales bacterium]|nr:hypothetical protein [Bacteroidales bacterium]
MKNRYIVCYHVAMLGLVAILFAACATQRHAAEASAAVPDRAFRTFLVENGYATRVFGQRMKPTAAGRAATELSCYNKGIVSLKGIEMFPQLTSLVCSGNPIEELDLNTLPRLEELYGILMPLRRLEIDNCHHLKTIELSYNSLDHFDLSPFPELSYFFCIFSPLTSLDLAPCPQLKHLYIRGTKIGDVDLTHCTNFLQLHATDTPLRTIRITTEQYEQNIQISCSDTAAIIIEPWPPLLQLRSRAVLLPEAAELGLTLDSMEHHYPNGMQLLGDSIPQAYMQSWMAFVQGLSQALREAGIDWTENYRLWGRAFFAPDGSVDHYFYNWTLPPDEEWQAQFRAVLEEYLSTFRFQYPMRQRFAQCGGIRLTPAS